MITDCVACIRDLRQKLGMAAGRFSNDKKRRLDLMMPENSKDRRRILSRRAIVKSQPYEFGG